MFFRDSSAILPIEPCQPSSAQSGWKKIEARVPQKIGSGAPNFRRGVSLYDAPVNGNATRLEADHPDCFQMSHEKVGFERNP